MKEYGPSDYRVMVDDQANAAYVFEIVSQERVEIEELHSQSFAHLIGLRIYFGFRITMYSLLVTTMICPYK